MFWSEVQLIWEMAFFFFGMNGRQLYAASVSEVGWGEWMRGEREKSENWFNPWFIHCHCTPLD